MRGALLFGVILFSLKTIQWKVASLPVRGAVKGLLYWVGTQTSCLGRKSSRLCDLSKSSLLSFLVPLPKLSLCPCHFIFLNSHPLGLGWCVPSQIENRAKSVEALHKTGSLMAQRVKSLPAMQETWVQTLGQEEPLKKEMAAHSSILAWKTMWAEDPEGL